MQRMLGEIFQNKIRSFQKIFNFLVNMFLKETKAKEPGKKGTSRKKGGLGKKTTCKKNQEPFNGELL